MVPACTCERVHTSKCITRFLFTLIFREFLFYLGKDLIHLFLLHSLTVSKGLTSFIVHIWDHCPVLATCAVVLNTTTSCVLCDSCVQAWCVQAWCEQAWCEQAWCKQARRQTYLQWKSARLFPKVFPMPFTALSVSSGKASLGLFYHMELPSTTRHWHLVTI